MNSENTLCVNWILNYYTNKICKKPAQAYPILLVCYQLVYTPRRCLVGSVQSSSYSLSILETASRPHLPYGEVGLYLLPRLPKSGRRNEPEITLELSWIKSLQSSPKSVHASSVLLTPTLQPAMQRLQSRSSSNPRALHVSISHVTAYDVITEARMSANIRMILAVIVDIIY